MSDKMLPFRVHEGPGLGFVKRTGQSGQVYSAPVLPGTNLDLAHELLGRALARLGDPPDDTNTRKSEK